MSSSDASLVVSDLHHAFGSRQVLNGLQFEVSSGEVFGLLGPNGSGKSTTLAILAGLQPLQRGSITINKRDLTPTDRRVRTELGVVFQSPSLALTLTPRDNLKMAAGLHGIPSAEAATLAEDGLQRVGLTDRGDDPVKQLSGGMRRKLDLARALIHRPSILLMDEPTSGLDEAAFRATWQTLDELRRDAGITIILSTHRSEEAERCDRLAVLAEGRALVTDTPSALRARLHGDLIVLDASSPAGLLDDVSDRFDVSGVLQNGHVLIQCEHGHELIPRLVEAFPDGRLRSVSLRQPTLADAFLEITGQSLVRERTTPEGRA